MLVLANEDRITPMPINETPIEQVHRCDCIIHNGPTNKPRKKWKNIFSNFSFRCLNCIAEGVDRRVRPRFFDQVGHETIYICGNKHFTECRGPILRVT